MTRSIYDAGTKLRDISAAAATATAADTGIAFDMLGLHAPFDLGNLNTEYDFKVVFHNIVVTGAPTSVTFTVEAATDAPFTTPVTVATLVWAAGKLTIERDIDLYQVRDLVTGAAFIRSKVTIVGGTSPTVAYGAYLTKE